MAGLKLNNFVYRDSDVYWLKKLLMILSNTILLVFESFISQYTESKLS